MEKNPWFKALVIILVLLSGLYLVGLIAEILGQFAGILLVFFLGWLLAFIFKPSAEFFHRRGLPTPLAIGLMYLVLFLAIAITVIVFAPRMIDQLAQIGQVFPTYATQINDQVASLQNDLNQRGVQVDLYALFGTQNIAAQLSGFGSLLVENGLNFATGLASFALNMIIVLVISFYFMIDGDRIIGVFTDLVPDEWQGEVSFLLENVDRKFGGFLRGQLIQAIIYAIGTAVIMMVFQLDYVLIASLTAGISMFIPFFGPFLGFIPPAFVAILSLPFPIFIFFVIALLILQQIVLNVIAPKVMSETVGMHPLLVFLALLLGVKIAGPLGAIFGIPVFAVLNSMIVLFYNRSEAIQRHRARRLGLVVQPIPSEIKVSNHEPSKPIRQRIFWIEPFLWLGKTITNTIRQRLNR